MAQVNLPGPVRKVIVSAFGAIFLALAIYFYSDDRQLAANHTVLTGTVTRISNDKGGQMPIVTYEANGKKYEIKAASLSAARHAQIGDQFEIWVSNNDGNGVINSFGDRFVEVISFGLISLFLFFLSYLMFKSR